MNVRPPPGPEPDAALVPDGLVPLRRERRRAVAPRDERLWEASEAEPALAVPLDDRLGPVAVAPRRRLVGRPRLLVCGHVDCHHVAVRARRGDYRRRPETEQVRHPVPGAVAGCSTASTIPHWSASTGGVGPASARRTASGSASVLKTVRPSVRKTGSRSVRRSPANTASANANWRRGGQRQRHRPRGRRRRRRRGVRCGGAVRRRGSLRAAGRPGQWRTRQDGCETRAYALWMPTGLGAGRAPRRV